MQSVYILLGLFFLAIFSPTTAKSAVFNAKSFMLDNGMQVVVVENHRTPVVTHMVWYKTGAADETEGKSGIAHFFEHLMFKGTPSIPAGEFSKTIRRYGGNDNAFTSQDYTAYFQSIPVSQLSKVMAMEADRMRNLTLTKEVFEPEQQVILEERRQRIENDPTQEFLISVRNALYPNHDYSIPIIGWRDEIAALTLKDATDFYRTWYAPNNAILIISGDVTLDEVTALAKKHYEPVKPTTPLPQRTRTKIQDFAGNRKIVSTKDSIHQPIFIKYWRAPSARQDYQSFLALQVMEEILSGGAAARLYKGLVHDKKIATSISLSYNGFAWDDGNLSISGYPAQNVALETLETESDRLLQDFLMNGATEEEVKNAISRMQTSAIYARDSVAGPAMLIGQSLASGIPLEKIERWPEDIATVTAQDVLKVAQKILHIGSDSKGASVTGYLKPTPRKGADK